MSGPRVDEKNSRGATLPIQLTMNRLCVILALLWCAVLPISCSKKSRVEKEPNSNFSTANEIEPGHRYRGYMDTPNDRDVYVLEVERPAVIDVRLSGARGMNLAARIYSGRREPKLAKLIDDNRKSSPERFTNCYVEPGTWFFEIFQSDRDPRKGNREDSYELELKVRDAVAEESEPNDEPDRADRIVPDTPMNGYYSPSFNRMNRSAEQPDREEDWFRVDVELPYGTPRLMDVTLSGVTGINPVLALYDGEGNELMAADNNGTGEGESIIGTGVRSSGTLYVMVAARNYASNHDEHYTLAVAVREHDRGAEIEANNDFETANEIVDNHIVGRMNSPDDRDVFLHSADAPGLYRIELRTPEDMDGVATIHDMKKERIVDLNNEGRGKREVYPNFYSEGSFYISIAAKTGSAPSQVDYLLTISSLGTAENLEREPNNDLTGANRIPTSAMSGYTSFHGDRDFFIITRDRRVNERFEVTGPKGGAIRVSVTDPLGYIIRSVDIKGQRKAVFNETIDKKGYLIVDSVSEDYDNTYTITLKGGQ